MGMAPQAGVVPEVQRSNLRSGEIRWEEGRRARLQMDCCLLRRQEHRVLVNTIILAQLMKGLVHANTGKKPTIPQFYRGTKGSVTKV